MMTDDDGRRRVEHANETITTHIVGITADIGEGEENQKRFKTGSDDIAEPADLPEDIPPSVSAALGGKDAITPANAAARKRRAEEEPDDPRSGVCANTGQDDDAAISGGATASGSGTKRPADTEANDSGRGDDADDDMIGVVLPFECNHCHRRFTSRNSMFKHLYHKHDGDGEGTALRARMLSADPGRRRPTLLTREGDPKSAGVPGCYSVRPVMAVDDFRGHPSPIIKSEDIDVAETKWKDIGSGIFAKTFKGVSKIQWRPS